MHIELGTITDEILSSYTVGGINHSDGKDLPSKRAVAQLCEDLLQLLFPGFHDLEPIASTHLRRVTAHRVRTIAERIADEACKSLRLGEPGCPKERADRVAHAFLTTIPAVRQLLQTDVEAAFEGDPAAANMDEIILAYPFLEAVAIQRCAHILYGLQVPILPRMLTEWAHARTGIDIHPGAKIGSHFFIDHGTGVVIGETSVIGTRVKLYQGVSLIARSLAGGRRLQGVQRHPTVEDQVTIYAGSTIMGGDTVIGAGSTIGANVFLTHSVAKRSLVFYEETRLKILDKNSRDAGYTWDYAI
jgi:serine O-acetyltransferase